MATPSDLGTRLPLVFAEAMQGSMFSQSHLQALAFSLLLGAMVGVIESGGGMRSLVRWLAGRVRSRRGVQTMIATSGLAIFFDDYANTLLLGGTMRSTSDRYGISREKLAYLVDSTAAPVAGLAVVGTWAAIEISYMGEGLRAGGIVDSQAAFLLFVESIPYRFYPWLALVFVFVVALSGRDFGPMHLAESESSRDHERAADDAAAHADRPSQESPLSLDRSRPASLGLHFGGRCRARGHGDPWDPTMEPWRGLAAAGR